MTKRSRNPNLDDLLQSHKKNKKIVTKSKLSAKKEKSTENKKNNLRQQLQHRNKNLKANDTDLRHIIWRNWKHSGEPTGHCCNARDATPIASLPFSLPSMEFRRNC